MGSLTPALVNWSVPARSGLVGATQKAIRQPDIVVPMFRGSYTIDSNVLLFGQGFSGSLSPIVPSDVQNEGLAVIHSKFEFPTAFGKGVLEINPTNAGKSGTDTHLFANRFGDFFQEWSGMGGGKIAVRKVAASVLGTLTYDNPAPFIGFDALASDYVASNGGNGSIIGPNFIMIDQFYTPGYTVVYLCCQQNNFNNNYITIRVPFNYSLLNQAVFGGGAFSREWDYFLNYADNFINSNFVYIKSCVPDFNTLLNHCLLIDSADFTVGGPASLYAHFTIDGNPGRRMAHSPSIQPFILDNSTLNTEFAGAAIQSTVYGHLFIGNFNDPVNFPGQKNGMILVSPDGTKYAALKLAPQDASTSSDVAAGQQTPGFFLDPSGVLHMWASDNTHINNSFAINLPWSAVTIPPPPPVPSLPNLCGCDPRQNMGLGETLATKVNTF